MRQMSVILGHPIFTGFRKLTGCQRDPQDKGVTFVLTETADKKRFLIVMSSNIIPFIFGNIGR